MLHNLINVPRGRRNNYFVKKVMQAMNKKSIANIT